MTPHTNAYPTPSEPVMIDLFNDGQLRELRYSIASVSRLKQSLGRSIMGRGSNGATGLHQVDEEMLPTLILEGLRQFDTNGVEIEPVSQGVTLAQIEALPSSAYVYLLTRFSTAFIASMPEKKVIGAPAAPETAAASSS